MVTSKDQAHTLKQPNCPWCGLPIRWGKGYKHVLGFEETGECGSHWFPDYPEHPIEFGRSKACEHIANLRGAIEADEERLKAAAIRVWGEHVHGCDAPDRMADLIIALRANQGGAAT